MNLGLPNNGAAPNRRLRLGLVPWSFGALINQGSAVGELTSEVIRQAVFLRFFRAGFDGGFSQFNLIEQAD